MEIVKQTAGTVASLTGEELTSNYSAVSTSLKDLKKLESMYKSELMTRCNANGGSYAGYSVVTAVTKKVEPKKVLDFLERISKDVKSSVNELLISGSVAVSLPKLADFLSLQTGQAKMKAKKALNENYTDFIAESKSYKLTKNK